MRQRTPYTHGSTQPTHTVRFPGAPPTSDCGAGRAGSGPCDAVRLRRFVVPLGIVLAASVSSATADESARPLGAADLALLFNATVPASRELAEYYAQRRGVPADHLIGMQLPDRETLDRADYPAAADRLRKALRDAGLEDRVRCLVTFYGLPIRVGPVHATPEQRALARELERQLDGVQRELWEQTLRLEDLARPAGVGAATRPATKTAVPDLKTIAERYQKAKNNVAVRLDQQKDETRRNEMLERFFLIVEDVEGAAALVAQVRPKAGEAHPMAVRRLEAARDMLRQADARIRTLLGLPPDAPERAEARPLIRQVRGLLGAAHFLHDDAEALLGHETAAALDSELALLWWHDYPLYRWQMNTLAWRVRMQPSLRSLVPDEQWPRKVLMIARLDAPTPAVVRRMIDDAVETERTGLKGTFYIDARGIAKDGSYGSYDQNLRDLAAMMKAHTAWPTVLDDLPALFAPGRCPDTALYCGWYSLRKYVPAFTFVRGAVGYHIASAEAVSLHNRGEQGWCKRMLDEGITATLGPVEEPYLHAFPLPRDFFGLLLTGRFSLAEVYAFTNDFNSWMMMLLGDPLYRPFAAAPVLRLSEVFEPAVIPEAYRGPVANRAPATDAATGTAGRAPARQF